MFAMWKRMGLTAKITLLFNSLNLLILATYGVLSVRTQVAEEMNAIDAKLAMATQSYVKVIGEDKLDRAFRTADIQKDSYIADVVFMGGYADDLGLAFLYSTTVVDSKAKYVQDGAPQSDIDEGNFKYPMDDYEDAGQALFDAWNAWAPRVDEYTDSFGNFRSCFMPLTTKAGNKVIIGADMRIDDVKHRIKEIISSQAIIAGSIFIVGFAITFIFARVVTRRMIGIGSHVNFMAAMRDFTRPVAVKSKDEIGRMAESINALQAVMKDAIGRAHGASVSNAVHAQQFGAAAASIQSQVETSSLQVEQLNGLSGEINRHAEAAAKCAASVQADIDETNGQVTDAHATLKELVVGVNATAQNSLALAADLKDLNAKMNDIKRILGEVTEISDQTDMLAINASIEAAQAGSVGKGFMVVADSVRGLAVRTQETVGESDQIINHVVKGINGIIAKMNEIVKANDELAKASAKSLKDIESMRSRFARTMVIVAESAASSGRIEASVSSMAGSLGHVASVLDATKAQADEIMGTAASIQRQADEMKDQLAVFVVG